MTSRWDAPISARPLDNQLEVVRLRALEVVARDRIRMSGCGAFVVESVETRMARIADGVGELAGQVAARVLAEELPVETQEKSQTVRFEVPDGWWETFRDTYSHRWWMRPWVKRRPIRKRVLQRVVTLKVDVRRYWTFPQAAVVVPELGRPVRVLQCDSEMGWR